VAHLGATAPTPGSATCKPSSWRWLIGFALTACVLVAGPVSGGAANPARALGPMIVSLKFFSVWAYVLGPVVGGVLGAVVYDKFIGPATAPDEEHAASVACLKLFYGALSRGCRQRFCSR